MRNINPNPQLRANFKGNLHQNDYYDSHPIELFLQWFEERPEEHQVEIAEFIGHFCYEKLLVACETDAGKIYACEQYLKSNEGIIENEEKLLLFIDDVIEFIVEINEIADSSEFACEEVIYELPNIISLYSMINELPKRTTRWLMTYHDWQRFKKQFSFFRSIAEAPKIFDGVVRNMNSKLMRHL